MDAIMQSLGIQRSGAPICGEDHVEERIVDVILRITGDRQFGKVGRAGRGVLDMQRRPCGVVKEGYPGDGPGVGAVKPVLAFARPAELTSHVAHCGVVGAFHGEAEGAPFGVRGGELGRKRHRLVRRDGEVVGTDLPVLARPGLTRISALGLEQTGELVGSRRTVRVDAEVRSDGGVHVLAPFDDRSLLGIVAADPRTRLGRSPRLLLLTWLGRPLPGVGGGLAEIGGDELAD